MKLFNLTQKKLITDNLVIANTFQLRNIGLINIKKQKAFSLFLKTRWGIHTFGVLFPLTILVCDNDLTLKKIKHNLKPNSLFFWNPKYQNIIELPFFSNQIRVEDKVKIK